MTQQPVQASSATAPPAPDATSGPEDLADVLTTTRPRGWLALATVAGIVVAVLIWSIVATVPQQVSVQAAISLGALRTTVVSPVSGQVKVLVIQGESVEQGARLAAVTSFDGGPSVEVNAPSDGTVGTIEVSDGQGVEPGTSITSVVREPNARSGTVVVTFLPSSQAVLFNSGDDVEVIVTDLATAQRVAIPAKVQSIAVSPSDVEAITTETGSPAFANELTSQGSGVVYRVSMTLTATSQSSPSVSVQPGEIVQIINTYAEPHPIDLLFGGRCRPSRRRHPCLASQPGNGSRFLRSCSRPRWSAARPVWA